MARGVPGQVVNGQVNAATTGGRVQRKCECASKPAGCDACRVRRAPLPGSPPRTDVASVAGPLPVVERVLASPGRPLDAASRALMESRFGHRFSRLQVHAAPSPAPATRLEIGEPDDALERAAEHAADVVSAAPGPGEPAPRSGGVSVDSGPGEPARPGSPDFGGVRIHADGEAAAAAAALGAEAFTVDRHVVFGRGRFAPHTPAGRHLLAHELTHVLQQQPGARRVQRLLVINSAHPSGLVPSGVTDPAAALTPATRISMMDSIIQQLCPGEFATDATSGEVTTMDMVSPDRARLAGTSSKVGCCCLAILTDALDTWTINVSQVVGAQTIPAAGGGGDVVLQPTTTPVDLGSFTAPGALAFQGQVPAAGHELCGHAALMQINAHPSGSRLTTDVHDPTVNIENAISTEQGVPASDLRGLAASGAHRGESVDRLVIGPYPVGSSTVASLPAPARATLTFAADYIQANNSFVDVVGHTDTSGTAVRNATVSQDRADGVQAELTGALGVPATITKFGTTVPRFGPAVGAGSSRPPSPTASAAARRRVEIMIAGFPAGQQTPPAFVAPTPHTRAPGLAGALASTDPCENLLSNSAYP